MRDNKKIYIVAVICILLFVACRFFWPTPVKKDLSNLRQNSKVVSQNFRIVSTELSNWKSKVQGDNLQHTYNNLLGEIQKSVNNIIVPTVDQSIAILELTELSTPEVIAVRDQAIHALQLYKDASEKMLTAIKNNDKAMLDEADAMLNQASSELDLYATSYKELARKHGYIYFD